MPAKGTSKTSGAAMRKQDSAPRKGATAGAASKLIDERIRSLGDWRGQMLAEVRRVIRAADPEVVEEIKWVKPTNPFGVPVWSHDGIICTGETYKDKVKITFAKGAALKDPAGLFNASLDGNARRAIDLYEGDKVDAKGLKALVAAAVALNTSMASTKKSTGKTAGAKTKDPATTASSKPKLLSGGNPQIPKGDGDGPVQAYIAAMPEWKQDVGRRLDALIVRTVPNVQKAVKWNSPFYGIEGQGWFVSYHVFTHYVKVTFFRGAALRPVPPVGSKDPNVRYVHIHEDDLDEAQMAKWVKQAAALPGWVP